MPESRSGLPPPGSTGAAVGSVPSGPATLADDLGPEAWAAHAAGEGAKDGLGLDHCEARSWHGRHRHMSLMVAAA